jgi:hypothetical protein
VTEETHLHIFKIELSHFLAFFEGYSDCYNKDVLLGDKQGVDMVSEHLIRFDEVASLRVQEILERKIPDSQKIKLFFMSLLQELRNLNRKKPNEIFSDLIHAEYFVQLITILEKELYKNFNCLGYLAELIEAISARLMELAIPNVQIAFLYCNAARRLLNDCDKKVLALDSALESVDDKIKLLGMYLINNLPMDLATPFEVFFQRFYEEANLASLMELIDASIVQLDSLEFIETQMDMDMLLIYFAKLKELIKPVLENAFSCEYQ